MSAYEGAGKLVDSEMTWWVGYRMRGGLGSIHGYTRCKPKLKGLLVEDQDLRREGKI